MISSTIFNRRNKKDNSVKLSLVSLMDIFTILVFFLLLNSGEAQKIENAKFIKLPDSIKGDVPHEELMILVNNDELWVGKTKIADIEDLKLSPDDFIEPLEAELIAFKEKLGDEVTPFQEKNGFAAIIMGDQKLSYGLLKTVMATCRKHSFFNISLAVNRIVDSRSTATINETGAAAESGEGG